MRSLFIGLLAAFLGGCGSINQATVERAAQVEAGMSKNEVAELLGPPGNRQFSGDNEAWQYCQTSILAAADKFIVIWFYRDEVTGLTSYTDSRFGMCDSFFRSVNWEDAPDHTVEVRQR